MSRQSEKEAFWRGRRVFITGCTGFLGSWLTAALLERGAAVVGLIRLREPDSELIRTGLISRITQVSGELLDYDLLRQTLVEQQIDTVFHLAGQTIVGVANRDPAATFETNIRGTWLLLEAVRQTPTVRGVVVASSEKAYGEQTTLPYREEFPLQGRHPYEVSKSCADLIAQSFAHTFGLAIAVTRCSNLYGGGDLNWNRLIPGTIQSVLDGQQPVIRSDGSFRRDYLYVADAVRGYLMLAQHLTEPGVRGQPFNLGSGCAVSALEVVRTIVALSDTPEIEPVILNEVKNEILDEYLSPAKAEQAIGWRPQYTLAGGLKEAMDWYKAYLNA
ncbi:putative sugar dehydratase/epimerase YfnG [Candidatus Promineifilum breve]|uniref:Sugar dehydratase/epimerase YfnG n=1 Tax=Candidatus Promineifilum breve TaxID=1806508 RepID=A0A160T912_9CHLR|nr:GDP-mannose 4,6-dehydratase [Candidatus Promineifilum breve]CUS05490.2 putative sugar dehydratase/epimerase YfnG [Candidatus Promineifilum breve]